MIRAAQAVLLANTVCEVRAPVRAGAVDQAVVSAHVAVEHEVLAQQPDRAARIGVKLGRRADRMPVASQQVAHRRAGADLGDDLVLLCAQHDVSPCPLPPLLDWNCANERRDWERARPAHRPAGPAHVRDARRARPAAPECVARQRLKQAQRPRRHRRGAAGGEHGRQHIVLHEHLDGLRHPGREHAAVLMAAILVVADGTGGEARRQDVRRCHRVLDREVDANPADRRHGVCCVADAQQPRPRPFFAAGRPSRSEA